MPMIWLRLFRWLFKSMYLAVPMETFNTSMPVNSRPVCLVNVRPALPPDFFQRRGQAEGKEVGLAGLIFDDVESRRG